MSAGVGEEDINWIRWWGENVVLYINKSVTQIGSLKKKKSEGFPAGPMFKNLTCNAGNTGSILSLGSYHMLQSN